MLATPGTLPSAAVEDGWAFEVKQDGQRAMIYLPGDGTMLVRARSGTDITSAYPEFLPLATVFGRQPAVLDGEIVALDEQGRSDFERLQQRMGLSASPAKAARMASLVPAHAISGVRAGSAGVLAGQEPAFQHVKKGVLGDRSAV